MIVRTRTILAAAVVGAMLIGALMTTSFGRQLLLRADKGPSGRTADAALAGIRVAHPGPLDYSGLYMIGALVVAVALLITLWARVAPQRSGEDAAC